MLTSTNVVNKTCFNKFVATFAAATTVITLAAMVAAAPMLFQTAAAVTTPADDCRDAIKTALVDRRITSTEMQTTKAECANGGAPTGCLSTIQCP